MADLSNSISNSDNLSSDEEEDWKCPMCSGMDTIDEETFWEEVSKCPDCEKFARYRHMGEEETDLNKDLNQNKVIFYI